LPRPRGQGLAGPRGFSYPPTSNRLQEVDLVDTFAGRAVLGDLAGCGKGRSDDGRKKPRRRSVHGAPVVTGGVRSDRVEGSTSGIEPRRESASGSRPRQREPRCRSRAAVWASNRPSGDTSRRPSLPGRRPRRAMLPSIENRREGSLELLNRGIPDRDLRIYQGIDDKQGLVGDRLER